MGSWNVSAPVAVSLARCTWLAMELGWAAVLWKLALQMTGEGSRSSAYVIIVLGGDSVEGKRKTEVRWT